VPARGRLTCRPTFVARDDGTPDPIAPQAKQHALEDLPVDVLLFCSAAAMRDRSPDDDGMVAFGQVRKAGRWCRRSAIRPRPHRLQLFPANPTRTAFRALFDQRGVCRDFAHLAVALMPLHEHPGALLHRLSRRHRRAAGTGPMDFSAGLRPIWAALVHVRRPPQRAAHRPYGMARGRRDRRAGEVR